MRLRLCACLPYRVRLSRTAAGMQDVTVRIGSAGSEAVDEQHSRPNQRRHLELRISGETFVADLHQLTAPPMLGACDAPVLCTLSPCSICRHERSHFTLCVTLLAELDGHRQTPPVITLQFGPLQMLWYDGALIDL